MAELLSQEEMNALMAQQKSGEQERFEFGRGREEVSSPLSTSPSLQFSREAATSERQAGKRVTAYNFKQPDRISKEQIRALYLMHDQFARLLSSAVSLEWRAMFEASLISVEQQPYTEFLQAIPDPGVIFMLSVSPLAGTAALEISPTVAFTMVDHLLGGSGEVPQVVRAATEIELSILEAFVSQVNANLALAWESLLRINFATIGFETRPQFLQIVSPNEFVLLITFHIQLNATSGTMNLCLPVATLEPIIKHIGHPFQQSRTSATPEATSAIATVLRRVPVILAAELPKVRLRFEDLLRLEVGDVIKLDHKLDEPIQLMIMEKAKFKAELMARNNAKAVRIIARLTG